MLAQYGHQQRGRRTARSVAIGTVGLTAIAMAVVRAPAHAVAAAAAHRAAATSGATVWGWGGDGLGQLGRLVPGFQASVPVRARLPRGTRVTSVRAGCFHTVALTAAGQVLTWGSNSKGQLGRGSNTGGISVTPARVTFPPGTGKITAVRAGCDFTLALSSTGEVLAWGDNSLGQIGIGTHGGFTSAPADVRVPAGSTVKAISAGSDYSLALTTTGQVLAWGDNELGQLGIGNSRGQDTPVPVMLPASTTVTAVAAGTLTSRALTSTGGVLAWGDNEHGELGDGGGPDTTTPVAARLPAGARVKALFGGCGDTVALTTAGKVLAWGDNRFGQLGDNTTTSRNLPVQTRLPAGTTVSSISAGCDFVLARTAGGRVLAWGANDSGQVGDGTGAKFRRLPVRVRLPAGVRVFAVASGPKADFSLAIG